MNDIVPGAGLVFHFGGYIVRLLKVHVTACLHQILIIGSGLLFQLHRHKTANGVGFLNGVAIEVLRYQREGHQQ